MTSQINLEIKGKLGEYSFAELSAEIARNKLNGSLRLANADGQKSVVYVDAGDIVFAVSNARRFRLFELLLSEDKISRQQLATVSDFANDAALRETLERAGFLSKAEIDCLVSKQIENIVRNAFLPSAAANQDGEWIFSPLVRIKGDLRFPVNTAALLVEHARSLPDAFIGARLKQRREAFAARPEAVSGAASLNLSPAEAFVYTRFETAEALDVESILQLSGMPEAAAMRIVYTLWLGGFLRRAEWRTPFSERFLDAVSSANLTLKKTEKPLETVAAKSAAEPSVGEAGGVSNTGAPLQETILPAAEKPLTLDEYIERTETAQNFYDIFDAAPDASVADIKRAYFALAKRFHPDLFHKEVGAEKLREIQNAFTKTAQAYETLKNEKSREVYDYKMRKELAQQAKAGETNAPDASAEERDSRARAERAAADFENGFALLMDEEFADALPFLARAVHFVSDNARYHAYYGKALSTDARQKHKAEAEMQAAIRLEPNSADYRLMLAEFFVSVNLPKRAEGELNRLLSIFPANHDAKMLLDSLAKR